MDGNRRWAKNSGVSLKDGILQGLARIDVVVDFCIEHKIPYLSLYAFSIENLKRTLIERMCVFNILIERGKEYAEHMARKGVRVRIVGDRGLFASEVIETCDAIETITAGGTKLSMQLLFCYGGRQEIVAAARQFANDVQQGKVKASTLNEESFKKYFWMGAIPDPELVIRTGFANRLSNFMVYQAAYSELYFPSCLWPDIGHDQLDAAFNFYKSTKRNFGA